MNEQVNYPTMSDRERYLFDLQGFIVIKGMLSAAEVKALNEALDANHDKRKDDTNSSAPGPLAGEHKRGLYQNMLTWEKPGCLPFRNLLTHRKIIPYLNTLLGRGWKLDHNLFIYTAKKGTEGLGLHGHGAVSFSGSRFYAYQNGRMRCGLINCQYQLADVNPGDGGLCVVPGSHKTNFPIPRDIARWEADQQIVYHVPMKAGDLVIFSESTTHGTLPWTSDNERRSLFYRYTPMYLHYTGGVYETTMPEWVSELTEAQQAVLQPPYVYNRPLIEEDGETVITPRREGE
jgi:ectoine hydroxylase-related dioxygenase (phytanoyl-CoA dioxygenase family)